MTKPTQKGSTIRWSLFHYRLLLLLLSLQSVACVEFVASFVVWFVCVEFVAFDELGDLEDESARELLFFAMVLHLL